MLKGLEAEKILNKIDTAKKQDRVSERIFSFIEKSEYIENESHRTRDEWERLRLRAHILGQINLKTDVYRENEGAEKSIAHAIDVNLAQLSRKIKDRWIA
jgi:hypothetical protein